MSILEIFEDTRGLFNFGKAPAPAGEIITTPDDDLSELIDVAHECKIDFNDVFQIAAVRKPKDDGVHYKVYILFKYPENLKDWRASPKMIDDFFRINKRLAQIIERKNGVPVTY